MIEFKNLSQEIPYKILKEKYDIALDAGQDSINAICIASYSSKTREVNARYVNLKIVKDKEFIFFSNYNSIKSSDFRSHNQISALIYWNAINIQIRMRAQIRKTSKEFNQKYFSDRSEEKNALAISSNQSKQIDSYSQVKENYNTSLESDDLKKCPEYWGGYSFIPYYFEFWEGHESRINKREVFNKTDGVWKHSFLQP
jgi:pyridoxamine 5'-phosphate oxidase